MKDETKKVIALFPNLQEGITVGVDVKSDGGDRVEIRRDGVLCWRSFEFEPDFYHDLEKNLRWASR